MFLLVRELLKTKFKGYHILILKILPIKYWLLVGMVSLIFMGQLLMKKCLVLELDKEIWIMLPIVVASCVVTVLTSWRVNIISLGAKESKALGINYKANMGILIGIATLLTAGAVSVSGTIGWIGLVIPNVVRLIVGSDNKKVLPLSMLSGAAFMIIVDMLARTLAPNEIPLSVITGIIGTPLFIYAIFKRRKELQ